MNFNVYLDDALARRLAATAKRVGARRNAVIRQAVADWVNRAGGSWPAAVLDWSGEPAAQPFEALRIELAEVRDDPLSTPIPQRSKGARAHARRAQRR